MKRFCPPRFLRFVIGVVIFCYLAIFISIAVSVLILSQYKPVFTLFPIPITRIIYFHTLLYWKHICSTSSHVFHPILSYHSCFPQATHLISILTFFFSILMIVYMDNDSVYVSLTASYRMYFPYVMVFIGILIAHLLNLACVFICYNQCMLFASDLDVECH